MAILLRNIETILSYISIWSVIIPIIIGAFLYFRLDSESHIILYIVIFAAVPQILRFYITSHTELNIAYNIYTFIEFFFIYALCKALTQTRKYLFDLSSVIYIIISFYFIYEFGISNRFLHELVCINNIFYVIWIFAILLEKYQRDNIVYVFDIKNPIFWYITGLLFYSVCTMVIFLLWNFIKDHPNSIFVHLWLIHYIFNINMYVSFSIGMYKNKYLHINDNGNLSKPI